MNIERFTPRSADPKMIPWDSGMWVRYDHAQAALDAKEAQIVRLMDRIHRAVSMLPPTNQAFDGDNIDVLVFDAMKDRDRLRERLGGAERVIETMLTVFNVRHGAPGPDQEVEFHTIEYAREFLAKNQEQEEKQ